MVVAFEEGERMGETWVPSSFITMEEAVIFVPDFILTLISGRGLEQTVPLEGLKSEKRGFRMKSISRIFYICLTIILCISNTGFSQEIAGYKAKSIIKMESGIEPGKLGVRVIEGEVILPQKMVVDNDGNIYILDVVNNRVEEFDNSGKYKRSFKVDSFRIEKIKDDNGPPKIYQADRDIAVDSKGNLYIYDGKKRSVREISLTGEFVHEYKIPEMKEIKDTYIDSKYGASYYDINIEVDNDDTLIVIPKFKGPIKKEFTFGKNDEFIEYKKKEVVQKETITKDIEEAYQSEFLREDIAGNIYYYVVNKKRNVYQWYLYIYDSHGQEKNKIELSYPVNFIDIKGNLYSLVQHGDPYIDEENMKFEVIKWERKEK